jgi:hypothetical protein
MQTHTDDTSLAFCQMMQAKDEQIRRLVLRMERCVHTQPPDLPGGQHAELLLCAAAQHAAATDQPEARAREGDERRRPEALAPLSTRR